MLSEVKSVDFCTAFDFSLRVGWRCQESNSRHYVNVLYSHFPFAV